MNKFLSFVFMFIAHFSVSLMSNLFFGESEHIGETLISSVLFVLIFSAICHFVGKWKRESWFSGKLSYGQILISKGKIRMRIKHYNTTVIIVDILKNQKLIQFLTNHGNGWSFLRSFNSTQHKLYLNRTESHYDYRLLWY